MDLKYFLFSACLLSASLAGAQNETLPESLSGEDLDQMPFVSSLKDAMQDPLHVYKLNLSGQGLNKIPSKVFKLSNLRILALDSNEITVIPEEIAQLKYLEKIYCSHNHLKELPAALNLLPNLYTLYVSRNEIAHLGPEITLLHNLEYLSLDHNKLTALPAGIGNLENLVYLGASDNEISSVPPEIGRFPYLQTLDLDGNNIRSLPEELFHLHELKNLYLDRNQLSELPQGFVSFPALERLSLSDNMLKSVDLLSNLGTLRELYLGRNRIDSLPPGFGNLVNIRKLFLPGNPLRTLPSELKNLYNLETLNISKVSFKVFPKVLYELNDREVEIIGFVQTDLFKIKLLISQGNIKEKSGDYQNAIAKYRAALVLDPQNMLALQFMAGCYQALDKPDSCLIICRKGLAIFPGTASNRKLYRLYYESLRKSGRTTAADSLVQAIKPGTAGASQLFFEFGKGAFDRKEYEGALAFFESAVQADSSFENGHFYIAICARILNKNNFFICSVLRFLTLESADTRATSIYPFLNIAMGMKSGHQNSVKGKKGATIYTDSYVIRDEHGKKLYMSENALADQMAAIFVDLTQTALSSVIKERSNVQLFLQKMDSVCAPLTDSTNKEPAFFGSYYAPYFREMKEKGHMEAFAYLVCRTHGRDAYILTWIRENGEKVKAFRQWSGDYRWLK